MLLGISIMLLGIYFKVEDGINIRLYGNEFLIIFIGFMISIKGFFTKDEKK